MKCPLKYFAGNDEPIGSDNMPETGNNYDVIVIGAGSVGIPISFYLAKENMKVLAIDSRASVGQGSNKTAIGGIRATHSDFSKITLCIRSIEIFSKWEDEYGDDIEWYREGIHFQFMMKRMKQFEKLLETPKELWTCD